MLSNYLIEKMGFEEMPPGQVIEARFHLAHIYHIKGVSIEKDAELCIQDVQYNDVKFSIAIGNSLNSLMRALADDDMVEDERKWEKDKKTGPPYALVLVGPTETYSSNGKYWQEKEGAIITYSCFLEAKFELKQKMEKLLTVLLPAISVRFFHSEYPSVLQLVWKTAFGTTRDGRNVQDIHSSGSASVSFNKKVTVEEIDSIFKKTLDGLDKVSVRAAKYFYMGLCETDNLKKFLFYFLSIEVYTHETYKAINFSGSPEKYFVVELTR